MTVRWGSFRALSRIIMEEVNMAKEHIAAGTVVAPGLYRCNACANEHECQEEGEKLPQCRVCDSISWKTYRLAKKPAGKQNEQA